MPKKSKSKKEKETKKKKISASGLNKVGLWHEDKDGTKASFTISFEQHIDAVVFVARLSIHAAVYELYPEITLTKAQVKIVLGALGKTFSTGEKSFMERVSNLATRG